MSAWLSMMPVAVDSKAASPASAGSDDDGIDAVHVAGRGLLIELRRMRDRRVLRRVVVDPQLAALRLDDAVQLVHRLQRLLLVEVEAGHATPGEVLFEVRRIAAQ